MPVTLPLEVYEALERGLGKEDARTVVKSLETTISEATEYKWATTKEELLNAIRREFVTRELFEEKINGIRAEMFGIKADLEGKIENVRTDLEGKIESVRTDLEGKIESVRLEMHGFKADIEGKIESVRAEMHGIKADLEGKIENVRVNLEGKIENVRTGLGAEIKRVDLKLNFLIILMVIALTLMNPVAAEIIKQLLGL
ncbi:MAG: hypothetical protein ACK415_06815 [Thermodesulfovibrionales bacterium]